MISKDSVLRWIETRKNWVRALVLSLLFGSIIGAWFQYREKIAAHLLGRIHEFSKQDLPMIINARGLMIRLITPMAELSDVEINPKPGVADGVSSVRVGKVRGHLDFLQALAGRVHLSALSLENLELELDLDQLLSQPSANPEIPWDEIFPALRKIPLSKVVVFGLKLRIHSQKNSFVFKSEAADLFANLSKDRLSVDLEVQRSHLQFPDQSVIQAGAGLHFLITRQGITLHSSLVEVQKSKFSASGSLNLPRTTQDLEGNLNIQSSLALEELTPPMQSLLLRKIPELKGTLDLSGRLGIEKGNPQGQFLVRSEGLIIQNFIIDNVETEVRIQDQQLSTKKVLWSSGMGNVTFNDLQFALNENHKFSFKASSDGLDIRTLLVQVTAGDIPVEMFLEPEVTCEGGLKPELSLRCDAKARAQHLEVRSEDDPRSTIAIIDEFSATGSFSVSETQVDYTADVRLYENVGSSKGFIHYDKGFQISFETPRLDFKNVHTLAGLSVRGYGAIKGSTQGDSHAATFDLNLDGQDLNFEKYNLGSAVGNISYRKGTIYFNELKGRVGKSEYAGRVHVDLLKEQVDAEGSATGAQLTDLTEVFKELVVLPVQPEGSGSIQVKAHGPLDFSLLSYDFRSQFDKVSILGEIFPSVKFNVISKNGEVRITQAEITKGKGRITLRGRAHPSAQVQLEFKGERLALEDSENVIRLDSNISGKIGLEGRMHGHILRPNLIVDTTIRSLVIDEQEFADSKAALGFSPAGFIADIDLFGGKLLSELQLPFGPESPFLLDVNANDWEFATIFTIIGGGKLISEYEALLSGKLRLEAARGGLFNSTGSGSIDRLLLKRGALKLENLSRVELRVKDGVGSLHDFHLRGPNSRLEIVGSKFSKESLDLGVNGDLDLRLLNIFFPFMEELAGRAQLKTQLSGALFKPEILGNVSVKNGFVKIKNFPHAFEKIDAGAEFSKSRININRIECFLGGGSVQGQGTIQIEGYQNLPTDLQFRVQGATLNVPAGVQTSGNAQLKLTGSWFPFLLSGDYRVERGLFSREFTEDPGKSVIQQSSFLPKFILKSAFEPLVFDLNVHVGSNFIVKNSFIDGAAQAQLNVQNTPALPALRGSVELEKGSKLLFRDKVFEATAGTAKFSGSTEMNPEIYVTARSRVQDYDISMILQGTAKNALPRLTSIPPLSETDIITLLALGVTTKNLEEKVQNTDQESSTSYQIGTAIIENNPITKSLQETLGVKFEFSSGYDEESGAAVRKFSMSRKISERLRATVTRAEGQQVTTGGKINYQIDQNWSAVGSVENREAGDSSRAEAQRGNSLSIFGLDLDFRREFR